MKNVRLMTSNGGFVVSGRVPSFKTPPAVLIWGNRAFTYEVTDEEDVDVYIEAPAVTLTELS